MIPYTEEGYQLLHQGAITLAKVEAQGIKIDEPYLHKALRRTLKKIKKKQKKLGKSKVMKIWRDTFRTKMNMGSNDQLGKVLFDIMGFDCPFRTPTGKYKTDQKTLATVDDPFVQDYLAIKKLQKATDYLKAFQRETVNGLMHPVYNLHFARTYRSSSDSPNFQNIPVRDEEIRQLVRRAVISRAPGWCLVEIDFGSLEVRVIACQSQDPNLIAYIKDPNSDMHRDMAMECYLLDEDEVTKDTRYCAKNQFVFPQFYGSYWKPCADSLWKSIDTLKLKTKSGMSIKKHLAKKGITGLGETGFKGSPAKGTFQAHIQAVEKKFWKKLAVHAKWIKSWVIKYQDRGWFPTKTGFVCQGLMSRNDLLNYPIQGPAFHLLLWSLIRLQNEIEQRGMEAKLCGQIHDSIFADVPLSELDEYLALANKVMTVDIQKEMDWLIVPLEIEAEVAPPGGSWVDKEAVEIYA